MLGANDIITYSGDVLKWSIPFFGSRVKDPLRWDLDRRLQVGRATSHAAISGSPPFQVGHSQSIGLVRMHNEDSLLALSGAMAGKGSAPDFGLFLVADGMGGHRKGERASAIATQAVAREIGRYVFADLLEKTLDFTNMTGFEKLMQTALQRCNENVTVTVPSGGTTVTAAMLLGGYAIIGHVGDSRAYLLDDGNIIQLTTDHSLVQRLQDLGEITSQQAANHPQRNVLLRAVGQENGLQADVTRHSLRPGARLLLCSDGLWGSLDDDYMQEIISHSVDVQDACDSLVTAANRAGGPDNITTVLVQYNYNSDD